MWTQSQTVSVRVNDITQSPVSKQMDLQFEKIGNSEHEKNYLSEKLIQEKYLLNSNTRCK